jgi:ATP-dependent Lhr-like helicase
VVSRLHRGEKRLVFCDSRSQVEGLGQELRAHGVRTFVSHSSLGVDERRSAEHAFAEGSDCIIVATSTLELGIDVGDLDRVVQINAPSTVASFLQRLGRTGRRPGSRRNCLFLATDEDALLLAGGLLRLWEDGFVEPVQPPALPYHVLAQQIMAQILQDGGGTPRTELLSRLAAWLVTAEISDSDVDAILAHLLETEVLFADGPIVMLGPEGEARYGARHFLELFSVFNTPPLVTVYHGVAELGQVDPLSFLRRGDEPPLLALGGRGWRVTHMDWPRKRAWVEPSAYHGKSRWLGGGAPMHFALGQAVAEVLRDGLPDRLLSQRARAELGRVRADYSWIEENATAFVVTPPDAGGRWWTFAGDRYNAALVQQLKARGVRCSSDALGVTVLPSAGGRGDVMSTTETHEALVEAQHALKAADSLDVAEEATKAMKFAECVPDDLLALEASVRFGPGESATTVAEWPIRTRIMLAPVTLSID